MRLSNLAAACAVSAVFFVQAAQAAGPDQPEYGYYTSGPVEGAPGCGCSGACGARGYSELWSGYCADRPHDLDHFHDGDCGCECDRPWYCDFMIFDLLGLCDSAWRPTCHRCHGDSCSGSSNGGGQEEPTVAAPDWDPSPMPPVPPAPPVESAENEQPEESESGLPMNALPDEADAVLPTNTLPDEPAPKSSRRPAASWTSSQRGRTPAGPSESSAIRFLLK